MERIYASGHSPFLQNDQNPAPRYMEVINRPAFPSKSLVGPIGIAQHFAGTFVWTHFLSLVGGLSITIALMNLLPIPVLDGGHAAFILFEAVFGKKIPNRFYHIAQRIGTIILILLIGYALGNDILKLSK